MPFCPCLFKIRMNVPPICISFFRVLYPKLDTAFNSSSTVCSFSSGRASSAVFRSLVSSALISIFQMREGDSTFVFNVRKISPVRLLRNKIAIGPVKMVDKAARRFSLTGVASFGSVRYPPSIPRPLAASLPCALLEACETPMSSSMFSRATYASSRVGSNPSKKRPSGQTTPAPISPFCRSLFRAMLATPSSAYWIIEEFVLG
mmetsp:Transcript_36814/g.89162  ORF Transcript_36814/g.89162 Transcript_36814/m.89162 type:complete len:204 (-) Transcript_36814:3047-3658(-)